MYLLSIQFIQSSSFPLISSHTKGAAHSPRTNPPPTRITSNSACSINRSASSPSNP